MYICISYVRLSIWIPYILHPFQELHGLSALLQALEHLRSSPFATKAALISLRTSARARWNEVEAQDAFQVIRVPRMDMMDMAIWVCLKIGYIPNYSHLIGIMIINHWV